MDSPTFKFETTAEEVADTLAKEIKGKNGMSATNSSFLVAQVLVT